MRKLVTFKCGKCDHSESRFAEDETDELKCTQCNDIATRQISCPKYFNNSTGRSPSAL